MYIWCFAICLPAAVALVWEVSRHRYVKVLSNTDGLTRGVVVMDGLITVVRSDAPPNAPRLVCKLDPASPPGGWYGRRFCKYTVGKSWAFPPCHWCCELVFGQSKLGDDGLCGSAGTEGCVSDAVTICEPARAAVRNAAQRLSRAEPRPRSLPICCGPLPTHFPCARSSSSRLPAWSAHLSIALLTS